MNESVAPPPSGQQLGQYLLLDKLGQGGMGTVYKALHSRLKRVVAIKVLPPERLGDPQAVARFFREMEAIGKLDHPHIIHATDAGEAAGQHYLVMEFIPGQDLARLVRRHKSLAVPDACELLRQTAEGLQYIHEHGLVHRDLKPSNLLLTNAGQVKILDLGLARLGSDLVANEELTPLGQFLGTADFMAPEQGSNSRDVDIRADIYSLGCTLYKLLTGQTPFSGPAYDSFARKIVAHAQEPVPPVSGYRGDVPAGLLSVLDRMLAKAPADRFATPAEVVQALAPFTVGADLAGLMAGQTVDQVPAEGPPSTGAAETGWSNWPTRPHTPLATSRFPSTTNARKWFMTRPVRNGLAAVVAAGLAVGAYFLFSPSPPPDAPVMGRWRTLLDRRPQELVWPKNATRPVFEAARRELLLDCPEFGAVKLGEIQQGGYKFQVKIEQRHWTGGVGIFFGYRAETQNGRPGARYQTLVLRPHPRDKAHPFRLERNLITIAQDPKGREISNSEGITWQLLPPPKGHEQILEIEVTGSGNLLAVQWGNQMYSGNNSPLTSFLTNSRFTAKDYRGAAGVFVSGATASFREAQLLLFER